MEKTKLLTVKEYQALLKKRGIKVTTARLYYYVDNYNMPHREEKYGVFGRRILIDPAEADAWIEERSKKLA